MRRWLAVLVPLLLAAPFSRADWAAPPAAGLRVHEWGVWKLRHGEVAHLADLQRESPAFVRHTRPTAPVGGGMLSRKPVVYFYSDRLLDLDVDVRFRGGGPWLFYPGTEPFECGGQGALPSHGPFLERDLVTHRAAPACRPDRLQWRVRTQPQGALVPAMPPGHLWNHLRSVPATPVVARDSSAERFLFYDGPAAFPSAYRTTRSDAEHGGMRLAPCLAGLDGVLRAGAVPAVAVVVEAAVGTGPAPSRQHVRTPRRARAPARGPSAGTGCSDGLAHLLHAFLVDAREHCVDRSRIPPGAARRSAWQVSACWSRSGRVAGTGGTAR